MEVSTNLILGSRIVPNSITAAQIAPNTITHAQIAPPKLNTLAGETAGTLYYVQVSSLSTYKKVVVFVSDYQNDTSKAQIITYPTAFEHFAYVTANTSCLKVSSNLTQLDVTAPNKKQFYNGVITVEGY